MKKFLILFFFLALPVFGQANQGELQLKLTDPSGLGEKAAVQIVSEANQYATTLTTNAEGNLRAQHLPYGLYDLEIHQPGFQAVSKSFDVHSSIPIHISVQLQLSAVRQSVTVQASNTLLDPDQAGSVSQIGPTFIRHRLGSLPGRSVQDLVNSQPGWLYEGNAVLHPRGSEYQTQFVIDGIPLTDNRSPGLGPEIEADDIQSVSIYTAGIPAEFGRKMGGVVQIDTLEDSQPGLHGQLVLSGGSFATATAFAKAQYAHGKNTIGASGSGSRTDRYLNPVVPENYSNTGTLGDFSANYRRELTPKDRIGLTVRHELARYDIPNERVQQAAGQRQSADNLETMGIASYQHVFSANALADLRGMVRENARDFTSNPDSTPIEIFQHNWFREGYFKSDLTLSRGHNEWKAGLESDSTFLNEDFRYIITDPTRFDPTTPLTFAFQGNRPDLEQSAFLQDLIRLHHWTINAGLRWDHYQLLLNRQAFEPRLAISRYLPSAALVLHFSYDRVFQTPSFENILLSSSTQVESLDPKNFLRLPVEPSRGDYYEGGISKVFSGKIRLDANYYRRFLDNFADDNQLENTSISFPISFRKGIIYGLEGKIELPVWDRFSGYLSYSYQVGNVWFPITGGLFLGSNAGAAATQLTGHFPNTQDQRNTVRGRLRYQVTPRFWVAGGARFDSGLPFDFNGDPATVLAEYGQQVLDRINFPRGRIYPTLLANASAGATIHPSARVNMRLQVDGENLTNVLDVIDFGGLFSGNAIGPPRSFSLRLTTTF